MSQSKRNFFLEFFFTLGVVTTISAFWFFYPNLVLKMDNSNQIVTHRMVIPYKYPQLIEEPKEETKFQKIGEKYGTYGDSFGSLNTLFSGLAFAMLILSLRMQRKELKAQREELTAQRNEITKSNEIAQQQRSITEQQKALNEQQVKDAQIKQFYDLLFKFLNRYEEKVDRQAKVMRIDGSYNYFKNFNQEMTEFLNTQFKNINTLKKIPNTKVNTLIYHRLKHSHLITLNKLDEIKFHETNIFILDFILQYKNLGITSNALKIFDSYLDKNSKLTLLLGAFESKEIKLLAQQFPEFFKNCLPSDNNSAELIMQLTSDSNYVC